MSTHITIYHFTDLLALSRVVYHNIYIPQCHQLFELLSKKIPNIYNSFAYIGIIIIILAALFYTTYQIPTAKIQ